VNGTIKKKANKATAACLSGKYQTIQWPHFSLSTCFT